MKKVMSPLCCFRSVLSFLDEVLWMTQAIQLCVVDKVASRLILWLSKRERWLAAISYQRENYQEHHWSVYAERPNPQHFPGAHILCYWQSILRRLLKHFLSNWWVLTLHEIASYRAILLQAARTVVFLAVMEVSVCLSSLRTLCYLVKSKISVKSSADAP